MDILKDYIIINEEISEEIKTLKIKVFNYFYYMMNVKSITSSVTLSILYSIETIQLISFAFSSNMILNWNISNTFAKYLQYIIEGMRFVPLLQFTSYNSFIVVFYVCFAIVFILFIGLIFQILFYNPNSIIFPRLLSITQFIMPYLTILFFIPLSELFFVPFKCENNKLLVEEVQCYKNKHLILAILGVFGEISFVIFIFMLNSFYFYPFVTGKATIKLNPDVDLLLIKIKLIFVVQFFFVKTHYVSITIILILSLLLIYFNLNRTTYSIKGLEFLINLRNVLVFWSFFMLLISRICLKSHFNNIIFLLVLSYPLITFGFIMFYHRLENQLVLISFGNNDNINSCLTRIKIFTELINSFIEEHKSVMKFGENYNHKNEIMLKGIINIHTDNCLKEDCPLTNFIRNEGNFSTQKQSLLNYMTIVFNESIKKFPNNILIRMYYIQFNYDQKYNLSSVKTTFEEIKNLKFGINYEYILYCQKKHISLMQLNENNEENDEEKEKLILEQNYKRLKNLITNATILYVEFWGIFATNITNNINTSKLYKLGEKLNGNLNEIHYLWKNNLKYKKIDVEYQNIAQLFARFLREILWDKKKSEIVQKKINEEQYLQGYNKINDKKKINVTNIGNIENQGYIIYVNITDKGKCNIIQFSNSLSFIIGYQKQELINKPLEVLMPSILVEGHSKTVVNYIKSSLKVKNNDNFNLNESEKKTTFILIKNKMGYIIPFNAKFSLFDDNDFSNSFLIKAELETTDIKSMYAYYLLTKPDLSLDCFSSSAIHLGLSMDLLKKYVIKLNILIRTVKDKNLNLSEKYKDYEVNQRIITWVYPDVIYPKNDCNNDKNKQIQDLISVSIKKKFHLQIFEIKYKEKEISGFVFKIFDTKNTYKKKDNLHKKDFIPSDKTQIIFDLLNLNYIRTIIVQKKSGLRNLREKEENDDEEKNNRKNENKEKRRRKIEHELNLGGDSSEENSIQVIITKEKLLELQTKDSNSIKSFINILPFYGNETSLIKHRPNKERYPTGKAQEPLIKISLNSFTKRIESRIKENPEFLKRIKSSQKDEKITVNIDNTKKNDNNSRDEKIKEENKSEEFANEIDKEFSGNSNVSLANILNVNSLKIIQIMDFSIYIITLTFLIVEFVLSYNFFSDHTKRYLYFSYSYRLLNDLAYIKYYVTEGILATDLNYYIMANSESEKTYILQIKEKVKEYLIDVNDIMDEFESPQVEFSKEYDDYISNTSIIIKTLNNGNPNIEKHPYISIRTKLTNALYHITMTENGLNITDKYAYELMVNLLDSYFISFEKIILILTDDFNERTKNCGIKNIVIFSVSMLVSIIYIVLFYKLIIKLDKDREKPINLFLTIKNSVFEDLKNSAENFSNKLLNKFFGVDEDEEESQKDFQTNLKPKDINIAKFKALNDYRMNNNKSSSYLNYFIIMIISYVIINLIFLLKYLNTIFYYDNINKFIQIYNKTSFSEIYLVTTIDVMKQYFYNVSILNYGLTEETQYYNFLHCFLTLSDYISNTIKATSDTSCFLNDEYIFLFRKYFYDNFSELLNTNDPNLTTYASVGYKSVNSELIENLRFLFINYFIDNKTNASNLNASDLINDKRWIYIDRALFSFVKPWYNGIFEIISQIFYDYDYDKQSSIILAFVIMIISVTLYYWIVWKRYEEQLIYSIEKSFELINLIPEEVKNIIAKKLNENS